jgi:hypothetical protein
MRKILLLLCAFATLSLSAKAQTVCQPNQIFAAIGIPGVYPNPIQQSSLAPGVQGSPYSQVFTFIVPADTTIDISALIGFPLPPVNVSVNYQEVTGMSGLPNGLNYQCDLSSCQWPGGINGCALLSGTPTQNGLFTVGMTTGYNVNIPVGVPVLGGQAVTIPIPGISWDMDITATSAADLKADQFSISQNGPNPFHGTTNILFNAPRPASIEFVVTDLSGKQVHAETFRATTGVNTLVFDATDLVPGVYIYQLSNGEKAVNSKMVVQ